MKVSGTKHLNSQKFKTNNTHLTNVNKNIFKCVSMIAVITLLTTNADAVPNQIAALKTIGDQVVPYLTWLIAMGGGSAFAINAWRVFQGQPKAAIGAMGGLLVSGIGFNGIFGEAATTLLI